MTLTFASRETPRREQSLQDEPAIDQALGYRTAANMPIHRKVKNIPYTQSEHDQKFRNIRRKYIAIAFFLVLLVAAVLLTTDGHSSGSSVPMFFF